MSDPRYVETRDVPVGDLHPHPDNPRRHDDEWLDRSIEANGQYRSVIARQLKDGTLQLLAGHGTVEALRRAGHVTARVEIVSADDRAARRILLVDNPRPGIGGFDDQALAALLSQARDVGDLHGSGWDEASLDALLTDITPPDTTAQELAEDEIPEPPTDPVTRPGDVWILGDHRLICGDCRDVDIVSALFAGMEPDLVLTDPPYGVNERTDRKSEGRDGLASARDFPPIHGDDEPFDPTHILTYDRIVLFGANYYAERLPPSPSWIVWDKLDGLTTDKRAIGFNNNADVELAWTNLGGPARILRHRWTGLMKASEHGQARVHPTQKPIAIMRRIVEWRTEPGDVVFDPYAGSGSTLLACEQSRRSCRAIEIGPAYCDVIVRRWEEATGGTAHREER